MEQPTCGWCHTPLEPPNRKWCSDTCRAKSKYYRDVEASRARWRDSYRSPAFQPVAEFTCAGCDVRCVPGETVGLRANRFCSAKCRKTLHRRENPERYRAQKAASAKRRPRKRKPPPIATKLKWVSCRECDAAVVINPRVGRPLGGWVKRRQNGWCCPNCPPGWPDNQVNIWTGGRCLQCSTPFLCRNAKLPKFCTDLCARRAARDNRRIAKRDAFVANVYRRDIYERDGYRCQLCRKPVKRDATVPHPKAPVLDHIIPLSKGGTHEPANVQLAHFMCNSIKSDNIGGAGDQLRLIG